MTRGAVGSSVQVRRAVPSDAAALAPLIEQLHEHEGIPMGPHVDAALARLLADPGLGFAVVALDPDVVGYAVVGFGFSLEFAGRDAFVDEAFVQPARRGSGLGSLLVAAVEAECQVLGIRAVHLEVDHANGDARRLYERLGYASHKRHLLTKWLGLPEQDR